MRLSKNHFIPTALGSLIQACSLLFLFLTYIPTGNAADPSELFEKKVFPLLEQNCFECHGKDVQHGNLRLDARDIVLQGGKNGPSIVPNEADNSLLYQRLITDNQAQRMPMGKDPLLPDEIALIKQWIDNGAHWQDGLGEEIKELNTHWAFEPPKIDQPVSVNNEWGNNPIDSFILEKIKENHLTPSPQADRKKLIRRMFLDVIGLPPTLEQLEQFASDPSPNWDQTLINDLLASPHYGEKWARHWLDGARYADTNGYEKDRPREIWPYRDYVIDSFNNDKPFDQFTIEQIAGDLLPNAGLEEKIATGFHRNTMHNEEGGVDVEEFRFEAIVDRVNTTSTMFLGLTVACAQCHTHKYDPITHDEYYQLFAYFNNSDEVAIPIPNESVDQKRQQAKQKIQDKIAEINNIDITNDENLKKEFKAWLETKQANAVEWQPLKPTNTKTERHTLLKTLPDQSLLAYADMPNNDIYTIEYDAPIDEIAALQLSLLRHPDLPGNGPGRGTILQDGNFMISEITIEVVSDDAQSRTIPIASAVANANAPNATAGYAIDGDHNTGWSITKHPLLNYQAIFNFDEPIQLNQNERLKITLNQNYIHTHTLGRFRLSASAKTVNQPSGMTETLEIALAKNEQISETDLSLLKTQFVLEAESLKDKQDELVDSINAIPPQTTSLVVQPRDEPRATHLYHRGEYLHPRHTVEPGVLAVLHPIQHNPQIPKRLQFAKWLTSPQNPLIARVTVNRIWMRYFGKGIVETVDDFGTRGSLPTHPELLDWLALEFMQNGWSLKHIHRLILSSATYQQSSHVTPELLEQDPSNELYARAPRVRLDAEIIRDNALSIAGLLTKSIGGPSVFPPMPDGLESLSYGGLQWHTAEDENRYRRGLYTYWKRTNPYPMLTTFDAPPSDTACVMRNRSNTPLQALTLLNDTTFTEAAQAFAKKILLNIDGGIDQKIRVAFEHCTARQPDHDEIAQIKEFYKMQKNRIENKEINPLENIHEMIKNPSLDPVEWGSWTLVTRALLNLDETITKE